MRSARNKQGQFILIAALLIALMIISVSAIMYNAVTYFRYERWEEYLIVVDGLKSGTFNLLTVSLANYTQTSNGDVLRANMDKWREDIKKAYAGYGVVFSYSVASGPYVAYGVNMNYNSGLNTTWNKPTSFSAANASASLNITSIGLTGYRFTSDVFLKMSIVDALWYETKKTGQRVDGEVGVRVVIEMEDLMPITDLHTSNFILFQINGVNQAFTLYDYYESQTHNSGSYPALNKFVYELRYLYSGDSAPTTVNAKVCVKDSRIIQVTSQVTNLNVINN